MLAAGRLGWIVWRTGVEIQYHTTGRSGFKTFIVIIFFVYIYLFDEIV